jgi:hypothetical protein
MLKNFTNNLEATAYGYALAALITSETDWKAEPTIIAVSAETDSRVKLIVSYVAGLTNYGHDKDECDDIIELTTFHFIDMDSIDLVTELDSLTKFFEGLTFDSEYNGKDDTDYR